MSAPGMPVCLAAPPLQLGESRQRALQTYGGFVDAILPLFGVGPVLDLGAAEPAVLDAWRWRGMNASAVDVAAEPERLTSLPYERDAFQAVVALHVLEHVAPDLLDAALLELARVATRYVFARVASKHPRSWWDAKFFQAGFGKHPLYQQLAAYEPNGDRGYVLAFERLPDAGASRFSGDGLGEERGPHLDMLRESGGLADAHVARYMLASQFVRPRDRVVDAACGLGYGTAIINDATRADAVAGLAPGAPAVRYAQPLYGATRPRVSFAADAPDSIERLPDGSTDVVIAFETLEELPDPLAFVREAARVLTPGGRFIASVPNHHLRWFGAHALLELFDGPLLVERLFAQAAGGGAEGLDAAHAIVDVDPLAPATDPEWWIVVAMKTPLQPATVPFREPESAHPDAPTWNVTAIERDYDNPWLVRALVTRGFRASSTGLLSRLAAEVNDTARHGSPDRGAALCVQGYAVLCGHGPRIPALMDQLEAYCAAPAGSPHVERWRISNEYVLARLFLQHGSIGRAEETFARCAERDCLVYGPLLATKTVDAAFWAGWLALQRGCPDDARRWWSRGVEAAQAVARGSWTDVIGSIDEPLLFGLREMTQVFDCASRCASGLHALATRGDQPGFVAAQAFQSMSDVMAGQGRALAARDDRISGQQASIRAQEAELESREQELRQRAAEIEGLHGARQAAANAHRALQIMIPRLADRRGIAVFGAGEGGRSFAARWTSAGGTVACFTDNRSELWGSRINGVPVIAPSDLALADPALIVIASSPGYHQISAQLAAMRLPPGLECVNGAVFP